MNSDALYRMTWEYREGWSVNTSPSGTESMQYSYVEGTVAGTINGRLRGTNHSRRRADGAYIPDAQGVIETDDGNAILFDYQGFGVSDAARRTRRVTRVMLAAQHFTESDAHSVVNDTVALGVGEGRLTTDGRLVLIVDFFTYAWRARTGARTERPQLPSVIGIAERVFDPEAM